jgi:hypothetical protein
MQTEILQELIKLTLDTQLYTYWQHQSKTTEEKTSTEQRHTRNGPRYVIT